MSDGTLQGSARSIRRLGGRFLALTVVCWRRDECEHGGSSEKACVVGYFVESEKEPPREGIVRVVGKRGPNLVREPALQVCQCVDGAECGRWHKRVAAHR